MAPSVSSTSTSTSTSTSSNSGSDSESGSGSGSGSSITSSSSSESLRSKTSSLTSPSHSPSPTSSTPTTTKSKVKVAATATLSGGGKRSLVPARWTDCSVRTIGMAECRDAALTLAHAFAADDYAQYLVADDGGGYDAGSSSSSDDDGNVGGGGGGSGGKRRRSRGLTTEEDKWRLHVDILTYTVASHCMSGLVRAVGAECDAVALWGPPGKHLDSWWTQLRSGMWRLYFQLSPEGKKRYFDEIVPRLHDAKVEVLGDRDNDAWFLAYLGTKPNSQGRGYGARLLQDMLARADAENRPIYLESSSQANNAYYEKFGFEVKRDVFLERGPVPVRLSIMVREPRKAVSSAAYAIPSPMGKKKKKFVIGGAVKGLRG